jgi:hypothetical protein
MFPVIPDIDELKKVASAIEKQPCPDGLTDHEYRLFQESITKLVAAHDSILKRVGDPDCDGCSEVRAVITTIAEWFSAAEGG